MTKGYSYLKLMLLIFLPVLGIIGTNSAFAQDQTNTISGKIVDNESGETVIGASVIIKGTTHGITTDIDGNFTITTSDPYPIVLVVNSMGYNKQEITVTGPNQKIKVKMKTSDVILEAVEIVDSRITDKQKESPLTVESMDITAIKEAPSGDFYESLGNMKGVDMTSASIGLKVINTRGFNSTSPVRSLQVIDGVDNQSPGLNFSLGNFLGASELDLKRVNIIAGASSAYYGPGAFNGVIAMETKDPFYFPGLSASVKVGERNMNEYAVRWAQVIKTKDGKPGKFAYKINAYYMKANDWEAKNYDAVYDTDYPANNPGGYDAVNVYGDEDVDDQYTSSFGKLGNPGLGAMSRTGYKEADIADYNTNNLKFNTGLFYKITDSVIVNYSFAYSTGTTVYQGDNRYSLKNIQFMQNKLEVKKEGKWFIRAYATNEDAGDSYDIVTAALRMQEESVDDTEWFKQYKTLWGTTYKREIESDPNYPAYDFSNTLDEWAAEEYDPWFNENLDSLSSWHQVTRNDIDSDPRKGNARYEPGTARYDSLLSDVTNRTFTENGARFFDKSALYHVQGEYKFTPKFSDVVVGGNVRMYRPNSEGTIFSDSTERITNNEYGVFVGVEKKVAAKKLKLNATLRMDKNENFDFLFSPAISMVYTINKNHTIRGTFSSAIRNPTLADQYLYYNVGRAILLGNLNGYDSLVTVPSIRDYANSLSPDDLVYFNTAAIRPEKVKTIEVGYRGTLFDKVYIDMSAYNSWYDDFIGYVIGIDLDLAPSGFINTAQVYRLAANATGQVTTQGVSIGANYFFAKNFAFNGNYSWNKLQSGDDDPIIPAYNTPEHKYNLGFTGRDLAFKNFKSVKFGFGVNYKWIQGFIFEGSPQFTGYLPTYDLVDAQVNAKIKKWHTTIKLGASNILNNQVYQVYGGPRVGRLAYISAQFEIK
jgi:outer membrane receptor protein involved in Fe transport